MSEIAAIVAALVLTGLALFQASLAGGSPWGRFALGRAAACAAAVAPGASFLAIIIYAMFALILLQKAGLLTVFPAAMVDVGVWVAVVFLGLGVPINAISRSLPERFVDDAGGHRAGGLRAG